MTEQNHTGDVAQSVQVTDAMVKAGAAAMCCQAQTLGCAAKQEGSEFKTCMLSTFTLDAQRCLEAALAAQPPAAPVETPDFETALRQALDDLTVEDGKCNWAEVANILPRMRGELRAYTPHQRSSAETEVDFSDPVASAIMGAARLHTHDHEMAYNITKYAMEVIRALPQTAPQSGLKVELAARNLRILGLEKSLDDAVVALQGILEHPGDEESWKDARKALPSLLRMLDRHEFEEAGFDTCQKCGERRDHNNHIPASSTTPLYNTLKDAEDHLIANGFNLIPDTCDWIKHAADKTIGAGCYYVDGQDAFNSKVRIEYETLEKFDASSPVTRPQSEGK